jgi:hypothetical protein
LSPCHNCIRLPALPCILSPCWLAITAFRLPALPCILSPCWLAITAFRLPALPCILSPSWPEDCLLVAQYYILSSRGQNCIQRPYTGQDYLLDKFIARHDYTLSPRGQDCMQCPCWPGPKSTYWTSSLLDRTTLCLHVARTASSVPLYWPGLHQVYYWTSSLLDRTTPCLHVARTASSVPLYWPGLHQV